MNIGLAVFLRLEDELRQRVQANLLTQRFVDKIDAIRRYAEMRMREDPLVLPDELRLTRDEVLDQLGIESVDEIERGEYHADVEALMGLRTYGGRSLVYSARRVSASLAPCADEEREYDEQKMREYVFMLSFRYAAADNRRASELLSILQGSRSKNDSTLECITHLVELRLSWEERYTRALDRVRLLQAHSGESPEPSCNPRLLNEHDLVLHTMLYGERCKELERLRHARESAQNCAA